MIKLKTILGFFFLISFLFDITFIVGVSITEKRLEHLNYTNQYYLSYHKSEASLMIRAFYYFSSSFRGLVAPALLLCVNVIFLRKLTRRLKNMNNIFNDTNQRLQSDVSVRSSSNHLSQISLKIRRNITKMIVGTNFLFIIGNLSTYVTRMISMTLKPSSALSQLSSIFSNTLLYISHGSSIFIYYNYDSLYQETLRNCLSKICFMLKKKNIDLF